MKISAVGYVEFLKGLVERIRAVAVDKPARAITIATLGFGAFVLFLIAIGFIVIALFRLLVIGVGDTAAFAITGGLFLGLGWLFWRKRTSKPKESEPSDD